MEDDQQFCLRWNNHQSTLISVFDTLLENGTLVDCTLAAEGKFLRAHKVVLSACSPFFATLLAQQYDKHPIFILKDVKFQELRAMMDYMYRGEVNISQDQLAALLKAAESLQIKGLSDNRGSSSAGSGKGDNATQKQNAVPAVVSKTGLTIEQKRPAPKQQHATVSSAAASAAAAESDVSMSREGSASPTSRKRKKVRRRTTIDTNNMADNHELSNSSSQSMSHHPSQPPQSSSSSHTATGGGVGGGSSASIINTPAVTIPQITSATSAANVLNVTKKTELSEPKKELEQSMQQQQQQQQQQLQRGSGGQHDDDDDDDDDDHDHNDMEPPQQRQKHDDYKDKMESTHSDELLIEPKSEYDNDETVEDLTLDDEELLEDLDQAGPSHGGEGSSHGYAQWQVDRSQDEVFLGAQEAAGQHRDAQETLTCTPTMYLGDGMHDGTHDINQPGGERFFCIVCGKNYLRKRHLQRHMRDECIGIPPRFECELCPSKFRRKYHLVRHLNARHGIPPENATTDSSSPNPFQSQHHPKMKIECDNNAIATNNTTTTTDLGAVLMNNFSVEAIMMKNSEAVAAAAAAMAASTGGVVGGGEASAAASAVGAGNVVPDVHFFQKLQEKLGLFLNAEALMKNRKIEPMNF